jgi:TfoX/Sxy family transcriptional regulator of competence genes
MAFTEYLVERVRRRFEKAGHVEEKKMMGGLVFMVNGKMCIGVDQDRKTGEDRIMARVGEDAYEECLKKPGAQLMDFTGRPMKGFIFVYGDGIDADDDLDFWVEKALAFNEQIKD